MQIDFQNNIIVHENKNKSHNLEINGPLGKTDFIWKKYDLNCDYSFQLSENGIAFAPLIQEKRPKDLNKAKTKLKKFLDSEPFTKDLARSTQTKEVEVRAKNSPKNLTPLALLAQKIQGVSRGYFVYLRVVGVGYRVFLSENILTFKIGFSHFYKVKVPNSTRVFLPEPTLLCLYGIDKNQVTQIAAKIKSIKPPSVYKGKGIRLLDELIRLKEGKKKS
jgi:ribosomal protein L6P/L9E